MSFEREIKHEMDDEESTPLLHPTHIVVQETPRLSTVLLSGYVLQIIGAILLSFWIMDGRTEKKFLGGITWFNLHPFFMIWGLGVIMPTGIISSQFATHEVSKRWYTILHSIASVFTMVALTGVLVDHNYPSDGKPKPNFTSAHTWAGLAVVLIFYAQTIFYIVFYYSKRTIPYRFQLTPYHKQLAMWLMVFSVGIIISGIVRKQSLLNCTYDHSLDAPDYSPGNHYNWIPLGCRISNWGGFLLVLGSLVTVIGLSK